VRSEPLRAPFLALVDVVEDVVNDAGVPAMECTERNQRLRPLPIILRLPRTRPRVVVNEPSRRSGRAGGGFELRGVGSVELGTWVLHATGVPSTCASIMAKRSVIERE